MKTNTNFYISNWLYKYFVRKYGKLQLGKNVLEVIYPELKNWDSLPWGNYKKEKTIVAHGRYRVVLPQGDMRTFRIATTCVAHGVDVETFANVALSKVLGQSAEGLTKSARLALDDKAQVIRFSEQMIAEIEELPERPTYFIEDAVRAQGITTFSELADVAKANDQKVSQLVRSIVAKELGKLKEKSGENLRYGNFS